MDYQGLILTVLGATFAAVVSLAGVVAALYRRELTCQEKLAAVTAELLIQRTYSERMHADNLTRLGRIERALHINDGSEGPAR